MLRSKSTKRNSLTSPSGPENLESRDLLTTLPAQFAEFQASPRLEAAPVTLLKAPDGRLIVSLDDNGNSGSIVVVKDGRATTAVRLNIVSSGEHGMIGMTLDPNFQNNGHLYLMYTTNDGGKHNRISRFTFSGDRINPNTERVLLDLHPLGDGTVHNGGGMAFGRDGKLYIGVGDNKVATHAESLNTTFGKILRINSDGSIPNDNPFFNRTSGINKAIYATGVRNPFTMDADPASARIYFNDVGPASFEEINEVKRGADYGWPEQAGPGRGFENPVHAYRHNGNPGGCAITGGRFNRASGSFPAQYNNKYYFTDYCGAWIYTYDPASGRVDEFASNLDERPVSPYIDDDGSIYYLSREARAVMKIEYQSSNALRITSQPADMQAVAGNTVTFSVQTTGGGSLDYQWQKANPGSNSFRNIGGADSRVLEINARNSDDGARYRVKVSKGNDDVVSSPATLTVIQGRPPEPRITLPGNGKYQAGDTIEYAGYATDPDETGRLPGSSLSWEVTFQHDDHDHPVLGPVTGNDGAFVVPRSGETSANTWFRIHLTATDSTGLETYVTKDIYPEKSTFALDSNIPGIELLLDGRPVDTPTETLGVVGVRRILGAASPQRVNGRDYEFVGWSNGESISHTILTPERDRTYTATFREIIAGDGDDNGGGGNDEEENGGDSNSGDSPFDAVTHFKFDEGRRATAEDTATTGVADDASLRDGARFVDGGKFDGAVRFDGDDAHVYVPNSTDFNEREVRDTTIAFWFKADNVDSDEKQLLFKQQNSKRGLNVYLEQGRLYVGGWNDKQNWSGTFLSTADVNSDRWHHVALAMNVGAGVTTNGFRGFLDGKQFGVGESAPIDSQSGDTSLGARLGSTRYHSGVSNERAGYAGLIDEFLVYHRSLNTAMIRALANAGGNNQEPDDNDQPGDNTDGPGGDNNGAADGSEIRIRVRGDEGTERFRLRIDGVAVRTFTATKSFRTLNYEHDEIVSANDVRIEFFNDRFDPDENFDSNLIVDYISIDGDVYQTEAPSVFSTGTWLPNVGVRPGYHQSETLNANGYFQYSSAEGGGDGGDQSDDHNSDGDNDHDHSGHDHDAKIPGIVTHFRLDEGRGTTGTDTATEGVSDQAILTSGAAWTDDGVIGGAVRFDGNNAVLTVPDSTDFNDRTTKQTTIAFWFNTSDANRSGKQLLFKQNGHQRGLSIYLDDGRLYVGGWNDDRDWSGTFLSTSRGALKSGTWHHAALVLDAGNELTPDGLRAYLDGRQFGSGNATWVDRHLGDASFGKVMQATRFHDATRSNPAADGDAPFIGKLDDIRVFHRALKSSELTQLAEGDSSGHNHDGHTHSDVEEARSPIPTIDVRLSPTDKANEFELRVNVDSFTVTPENVDQPSVSNEGHMHLYIDGERVGRLFDLRSTITLEPGTRFVEVELATNDHRAWAVNGTPIRDGKTVTVDAADTIDGPTKPGTDPSAVPSTVPRAITHFSFDEGAGSTARDSASGGTQSDIATLSSGATWTEGIIGEAIEFDGESALLSIPDSTDFNDQDLTKTTVSFWFYADDVSADGKQALFKQNGHQRGINAYLSGGRLYVGAWSDVLNWDGTFLSTRVQSNRWYHAALTLDGGSTLQANRFKGYLNGSLFGSGDGAQVSRHLGNISLGALDQLTKFHSGESRGDESTSAFQGRIDDFLVYDRVLSRSQIQTLAGSVAQARTVPAQDTVVAPMDHSLDQQAVDNVHSGRSSGDANQDGRVDFADFLIVANNYASEEREFDWSEGDFDGNGRVDFADFLELIGRFEDE